MTDQDHLAALIAADHPCISIQTFEEDEALLLVTSTLHEIGKPLLVWSNADGIRDGLLAESKSIANTEHPAAACFHLRTAGWESCAVLLDIAGHLKDDRTLRELRELIDAAAGTHSHIILIDYAELPAVITSVATPLELSLPDETELERLVAEVVRVQKQRTQVQVHLSRQDADTILRNLKGLTARQARQVITDVVVSDHKLDISDLNHILAEKRRLLSRDGLLEYIEAPVDISEIGGLRALKTWLAQRQDALSSAAISFGIPAPRGVLMLGVQGAGKSLAAKAVATAWGRPLLRLDPGVLFDRYVGESERRLRDALDQAEVMAPLILWIDEIEKGFASAASQSVDGGLSKRMFGSLLTWMQEHKAPVFIIATANDIESLPPELLRKGRFDEVFFVDLPDPAARAAIFQIHLKKRHRDPALFDLPALVAASAGFSGSEIEQAVIAGLCDAYAAKTELNTAHILNALQHSPPLSVTMAEKVAELRAWAQSRCVPAD